MADDLMTNLRAAGTLLDRRGAEAMGPPPADGDHTPVYGLTPLAPRRPRSTSVWLGAVATVLVLAAAVAVATWNRNDTTGVASSPTIVALVPGDLEGWDTTASYHPPDTSADDPLAGLDMAVYVPSTGTDERERAVNVAFMPWMARTIIDASDTEIVEGAGLRGTVYADATTGRRQLFILDLEVGGSEAGLGLTSGPAVEVDELFELAAALDLDRPLGQQALPGWTVRASYDQQRAGEMREVFLSASTPLTYDSAGGTISTLSGVSEDALWILTEPFRATDVEMRGRTVWLVEDEFGASASWVEAPGVVVRVTVFSSDSGDTERRADLLTAVVEGLVPVDRAGWEAFAAAHGFDPGGSVGVTTTTDEADSSAVPRRPGARAEMTGPLSDGVTYQLWLDETDSLCWALFGSTYGEGCDEVPSVGGGQPDEPRVVRDWRGDAVLVYGLFPADVARVEGTFRWSGREERTGSASGGELWAMEVPTGARTAMIRYMDADGIEIERFDLELATRD